MRKMRKWRIASEQEILSGKTTDIYFEHTVDVLRKTGINPIVHAEVTVSGMPDGLSWGVLAGIDDVLYLFENKDVQVYGLPEGTVFFPNGKGGVKIPVLSIEGPYTEFAVLETPMLGFLCHTSGMVTRTAQIRKAAGDKTLLSFGARRTHPAITPQVEYAAYIGGGDGVSCVLGADLLDMTASGTMPHALIISFEDKIQAWQAFDEHVPEGVPRIAIVDTYSDEVAEAISAAENVPNLSGVRLDTPKSRRGDFRKIIEEVRWELDIRGYEDIKIYVSGGLDREKILELQDAPVDGYGVGGAISNSPSIDFAMDIVAIRKGSKWKPAAKRGKFSGKKQVWSCGNCGTMDVIEWGSEVPKCHNCRKKTGIMTENLIEDGKITRKKQFPKEIRDYIQQQLEIMRD
jgi:nicotinate phosphoribosyltransferase